MTPDQYYFPYLFNIEIFSKKLTTFDLSAYITYEENTEMPDKLVITKTGIGEILLTLSFGCTIMIDENHLFYWEVDTNLVDITQVDLLNLAKDPWLLNAKLNLADFSIGKTLHPTYLDTACLIAFARKDSLVYRQPAYEKFVIVVIEKEQINLIPFDWFNEAYCVYDYSWPATATLDQHSGKLCGRGMRIPDFCTDISQYLQ